MSSPDPDQEHDGSAVDALLAAVRAGVERVTADQLAGEVDAGALVVDIRPVEQRTRDGELAGAVVVDTRPVEQRQRDGDLPGAIVLDRNVLEWRLDPACEARLPLASYDLHVVVVCNEGYSSSLAAATLQQLGVDRATDLVGGFRAWKAAGLPVT